MWSKGRAILALVVVLLPSVTRAQPQVTATGAIIIDANTGAVVWEQDADLPLPPASTTKVLTAIVALQSGRLDQRLLVTGNASAVEPTKIGLRPGQEVDLHDLLYAVLLRSANDAAVVVAEGLGGSIEAFAQRMNEKARSLGATRSNFVNPHGLTEPGHYTTARDLATIFRYGLRVPLFRDILSTPTAEVAIDGPDGRVALVRSHNRLLNAPEFQVIGKTGFTRAARRCFVGAAGDGYREVVIALLGSTDLWGDARRMLYYGLGEGQRQAVQMASAPGYPGAVVLVPRTTIQARPPAEEPPPQPQRVAYVPPPPPPPPAQPAAYVPPPPPSPPPAALAVVARAEPTTTAPPPPAAEPQRIAAGPPADNDDDDHRPAARSRAADSGRPSQEVYDQEIGDGESARNQAAVDYARRRTRSMWADPPDAAPTAPRDAPPPTPAATAPAPAAAEAAPARAEAAPANEPVRATAPAQPAKAQARAADDDDTAEDSPRRKSPAPQVRSTRTAVASAPAATTKDRASARKAARDEDDDDDDTPTRATAQKSKRGQAVAKADTSRRSRVTKDDDDDDEDVAPRSRRRNATDEDRRQKTNQLANAKDRNGRTASTKGGRDASVTRVAASDARRPTSGKHGRGAADSDGDPKLPPPGRFTVQVGPYRNRKAVEVAREDLSRRGYEAKVVGQRLQLGNFTQKGLADRLATQLRVSGHPATSATLR
jgi:serine-type D-Ala-D-Ala carboxypeptidase (penicillin-binding protein 5/6)